MALLKYEMKCSDEVCGKTTIILVDPEETEVPNKCAFCAAESFEVTGEPATED